MSFQLHMFQFEKRTNSTLRPQEEGDLFNCNLNTPTDLMEPVFRLEDKWPDPGIDHPSLMSYNYIYVETWFRYYWIDKWVWNNGFWDAHCHIDPLASWRDEIGALDEYVLRSASTSDPSVVDNLYPLSSDCTIRQALSTWQIPKDPFGAYVIGVVGGDGLVQYYYITAARFSAFGAYMFGDTLWNSVVHDDPGVVGGNIPTFMRAQFNPLQYVVSCMWFPFVVPQTVDQHDISFGYFSSGFQAPRVVRESFKLFSEDIPLYNHPQSRSRGRYLQLAPFTRLRLSALPWGEVDLDTTKFANQSSIKVEAWVDPITGTSKLYVSDSNNQVILTLVGQIGVTEQLSQVLKDNLATVTGAASAAAGIVGGLMSGSVTGGIATAVSGIGTAAAAQYPDVSSTGTNGARIAVTPTRIKLTQTFQNVVGDDPENRGRPLCKRSIIHNHSGYLMIADPDVPLPATQEEIDKIKEYMANGFFYE